CAYAEFDNATGTLTFRYKGVKSEGAYGLNEGRNLPDWNNLGTNVKKVVFDASFASARPTNCYGWFKDFTNLTTIEGFEYLNTENVTNMTGVFNGCSALTSLDLTNFNTAKVTDMKLLFANCSALESLDLSMFNTENVTSMPNMFNGAKNLKTLNVSSFNTGKVKNMGHMFANCPNLTSLDLSSFNTKGVEYVDNIFKNCSNLTTIYASENFAFGSGLKNGADMFLGCDKLKGFIEYNKNTDKNKTDHTFANYKTGYFTKLVGKNGEEKIGAVGEILTAENLTLNDDKDFVAYEPFAAKAASYNRTMKEGTTWATLCLPFEVSPAGKNFRAFELLSADDATNTIELEEITTSIAAGKPVIIKMNEGQNALNFSVANKEIAHEAVSAADGDYQLLGIYTQKVFDKEADNNCYIVKGNKLMNPAKLLANTKVTKVVSKPFRAYMVDNSPSPAAGAKMFSIGFDDDSTTAIDTLNTIANDKAEYYDLQGKRLNEPQKGINIVKRGNKTMKVIIK
ncbi:BspA family leucine-rich repeat surface protein, partial [Prevotella merdae]|uniref:BspA family leucine-rich repeat surface protein n=1 Tax=Prevotella merdae TaxID=2079531 RepID=UPI003F7EE5A8